MKGFILDSDTWIEFFRHRGGVDKHIAETPNAWIGLNSNS